MVRNKCTEYWVRAFAGTTAESRCKTKFVALDAFGSLWLHAGGFDHPRPFLDFLGENDSELGR
jgi:hypothetical protein